MGTTIFQNILAKDKDTGVNGLVEYTIIEGNGYDTKYDYDVGGGRISSADGYGFFAINLPHQGQVTVNRTLDYEKTQRYYVTIVASVGWTATYLHRSESCRCFFLLFRRIELEMNPSDCRPPQRWQSISKMMTIRIPRLFIKVACCWTALALIRNIRHQ